MVFSSHHTNRSTMLLVGLFFIVPFIFGKTVPPASSSTGKSTPLVDRSQQLDLLKTGRITNDSGIRYDVLVIPGYIQPARETAGAWKDGASEVGKYFDSDLYEEIGTHVETGNSYNRWFLLEEGFGESARKCADHFRNVGPDHGEGVVGRPSNYFWSSLDLPYHAGACAIGSSIAVPTGLIGASVNSAINYGFYPAREFVTPAAKSARDVIGSGIIEPVFEYVWQTTVGNSSILLGGKEPHQGVADGAWYERLGAHRSLSRLNYN